MLPISLYLQLKSPPGTEQKHATNMQDREQPKSVDTKVSAPKGCSSKIYHPWVDTNFKFAKLPLDVNSYFCLLH